MIRASADRCRSCRDFGKHTLGGSLKAGRADLVFARIGRRRRRTMNSLRLVRTAHPGVSDIDVRMMERAIRLARQAALHGEVPIAAIVYRGEEVIAEAANNREREADPTGHAEIVAIREAGRKLGEWRLEGCSMAVTLEPCPMCAGALVNARLTKLVYGATDPKAGACETLYSIPDDARLNHRCEMHGGVMANQCVELLRAFFRERRAAQKRAKEVARAADAARENRPNSSEISARRSA